MLYAILLATISTGIGQDILCDSYQECLGDTLSGDTVTCSGLGSCDGATITAEVLDCSYDFSCYYATATISDSASCGDANACIGADITVSADDCDETGVILCTSATGSACQQSTLTSDSVVCGGTGWACSISTIETNSLDCTTQGACEYTTVTFSGDGDYSTITAGAYQAVKDSTLTQSDGDSTTPYTLDVFLNDDYAAQNSYFYSGDYNYMNVYYNDYNSGIASYFYCEAYATCVFYCNNYAYCAGSVAYIDSTATYSIGGTYGPSVSYTSSTEEKSEKTKLKSQKKKQEYKTKLLTKMDQPAYDKSKELEKYEKHAGQNIKQLKQIYKERQLENTKFINNMKTNLAKNSRKSNYFNNINVYYIVFGAILLTFIGIVIGFVLAKIFSKSTKGQYQPLRQPNLQYV